MTNRVSEFTQKLNYFNYLLHFACYTINDLAFDEDLENEFSKHVHHYLSVNRGPGVNKIEFRIFSLLEFLSRKANKTNAFQRALHPFSQASIAANYLDELMLLLNDLFGQAIDIEKVTTLVQTIGGEESYDLNKENVFRYTLTKSTELQKAHAQLSELYCAVAELAGNKSEVVLSSYQSILKDYKDVDDYFPNESKVIARNSDNETCHAIVDGFYRLAAEHARLSTRQYFIPRHEVMGYLYQKGRNSQTALECYIEFIKQNKIPEELIVDIKLPSGRIVEKVDIYKELKATLIECAEENLLWRLDREFCRELMNKSNSVVKRICKDIIVTEDYPSDEEFSADTMSTSSEGSSPVGTPVEYRAKRTQSDNVKKFEDKDISVTHARNLSDTFGKMKAISVSEAPLVEEPDDHLSYKI